MPRRTHSTPRARISPRESMGYPRIEELIETEDFTVINEAFESAYAQLAEMAGRKRGLKQSREAKKVMKAMELVMDLFRELLAVKYQLQDMNAGSIPE